MIEIRINNIDFVFESNELCFSPKHIDNGTLAMLSCIDFKAEEKVLDLGCGYGVVGIAAAKITSPQNVYMTDINENAIIFAKKNIQNNKIEGIHVVLSDAYKNLDESQFDLIINNPPYHADFSIAKMFIEKGFNRLKVGGRFFMVTKRKDWYMNKFISIFGGVKIKEINEYFVFEAEKRSLNYSKK